MPSKHIKDHVQDVEIFSNYLKQGKWFCTFYFSIKTFTRVYFCMQSNLVVSVIGHLGRCRSCNFAITVDDLEDWVYLQIEDNTHLLHGVVHSNGYGHLLTLNGREGGSKLLSGSDIMNFWDRLCAAISVRSALLNFLIFCIRMSLT